MSEWYMSGSASTLNSQLTCELVQDMLTKLENNPEREEGPTVSAYFAHSSTFQLFLTGLGVAVQDTPLRADNYADMTDRQWMTSTISPFATNMALVRYECAEGVKIQFLLNERPLLLDWCSADGLCDWLDVQDQYTDISAATCSTFFCPSRIIRDFLVTLYVNQ